MGFYDTLAETAVRLITEKGRAVSLLYKENGSYSPSSDVMAGSSIETVETVAAITEYQDKLVDGTLILAGDKQALLFAKDLVKPRMSDILTDGGVEWNIVRVGEIGPGDTPIIYKLQLRR